MKKPKISCPLYVTKKLDVPKKKVWLIRAAAILGAFLLSGIIFTILKPGTFGVYFTEMFRGTFGGGSEILSLLQCISIYLLLALAVTPAFKMKFWNIGGEGQAMAGCIVTAVTLLMMPRSVPDPLVIVIALVAGIGAGMFWALIPTFFKVRFNTNETLFTLMMNYVATALAAFTIAMCAKGGSQTFPAISNSRCIVSIGSVTYLPTIIVATVILVAMIFYMGKTKQGYELSVVGDSVNTAKYIGINVKKVTYRTMAISGALCGLVGFLLVAGQNRTLTDTLVGGKGFTAVLISWLGHFNPAEIAVYASLIGFFDRGTFAAASKVGMGKDYFSGIVTGLFVLVIVASEFFVRYKVHIRHKDKKQTAKIDKKEKEAK